MTNKLTYSQVFAVLEYLERKRFLAGTLTAPLVMSVLAREDEQDLIPELEGK